MALYLFAVDETTGKKTRTTIDVDTLSFTNIQFADSDYDVSGGGQSNFTVSNGTLTVSNAVDVLWNGQLLREGVSYTRNTSLNRIEMAITIPAGAWIRIRIYSTTVQDSNYDVPNGGQENFTLSNGTVTVTNKIDVWKNGQLLREGTGRFTRNTSLNRIEFAETQPAGAWIKIRIY